MLPLESSDSDGAHIVDTTIKPLTLNALTLRLPRSSRSCPQELKKENVGCVVRVCDSTYDRTKLETIGIQVNDWPFPDGDPPPDAIITNWLNLVKNMVPKPSTSNPVSHSTES